MDKLRFSYEKYLILEKYILDNTSNAQISILQNKNRPRKRPKV